MDKNQYRAIEEAIDAARQTTIHAIGVSHVASPEEITAVRNQLDNAYLSLEYAMEELEKARDAK